MEEKLNLKVVKPSCSTQALAKIQEVIVEMVNKAPSKNVCSHIIADPNLNTYSSAFDESKIKTPEDVAPVEVSFKTQNGEFEIKYLKASLPCIFHPKKGENVDGIILPSDPKEVIKMGMTIFKFMQRFSQVWKTTLATSKDFQDIASVAFMGLKGKEPIAVGDFLAGKLTGTTPKEMKDMMEARASYGATYNKTANQNYKIDAEASQILEIFNKEVYGLQYKTLEDLLAIIEEFEMNGVIAATKKSSLKPNNLVSDNSTILINDNQFEKNPKNRYGIDVNGIFN